MKNSMHWTNWKLFVLLALLVSSVNYCNFPVPDQKSFLPEMEIEKLLEDFTLMRMQKHLFSENIPPNNLDIFKNVAEIHNVRPDIAFYSMQKFRPKIFERLFDIQ